MQQHLHIQLVIQQCIIEHLTRRAVARAHVLDGQSNANTVKLDVWGGRRNFVALAMAYRA